MSLFPLACLEGIFDGTIQFIHINRFFEICEGAGLIGLDAGVYLVKCGNHDNLNVCILSFQILEHSESVDVRKTDVQDNHVGGAIFVLCQSLGSCTGGYHTVAFLCKIHFQGLTHGRIIVNYENLVHCIFLKTFRRFPCKDLNVLSVFLVLLPLPGN